MKRFLAGLLVGLAGTAAVLNAQHRASEKIIQPQVLVDNTKIRMVRWVLKPGEGTPIHTHTLDHISVIIHRSTVRDVETNGTTQERVEETGRAAYNFRKGATHSFANVGNTTFESISIELKDISE